MDYILVCKDKYCKNCGEKYTNNMYGKWCEPCLISYLKNNFTNWTSGNEKIDDFIQKMQGTQVNIICEWIPYNQFIDIKIMGKDNVNTITIYSAIWKNGPLVYNGVEFIYKRNNYEKIVLKYLNNSQNRIDKFLNEV
jgi:hypothetical protein